jgi:uncharacterized protein (DUF58 family)
MFRNHRVTYSGMIFVAITGFVCIAAMNSGTNLLYLALGLMVGGLVVSALIARLSLSGVEARRIMSDHVVARESADIHYQITNKKRYWPCFAVRVTEAVPKERRGLLEAPTGYALHVPAQKSVTVPTRLLAVRRGLIHLSDIQLTCSFPFGFVEHAVIIPHPQNLIVYPRIGTLNRHLALRCLDATESGTMTSGVRRGNDEFYGVREYRSGDNMRSIHWRSSARMGELMIREMANNAPPQMIVVLNVRRWRTMANGEDRVERAVEVAASVLCYAFLENFAAALAIAGAEGDVPPKPQMGRESRSMLLHRLATLNLDDVQEEGKGVPMPNRLRARAEWVIITLKSTDRIDDLHPPGAAPLVLALDAPDHEEWVQFVSGDETLRILRESPPVAGGVVTEGASG